MLEEHWCYLQHDSATAYTATEAVYFLLLSTNFEEFTAPEKSKPDSSGLFFSEPPEKYSFREWYSSIIGRPLCEDYERN